MNIRIVKLLLVLFVMGCSDVFEYSPNQVFDKDSEVNLNLRNLEALYAAPQDDTIAIAFVGDSQRFYDELEKFIDAVNQIPSLDFVLLAGDITDFGLLEEYEQVHERLERINKPYFGIIGNHDVLAKGEETFERMYGPLNFSFTYQRVKFILHNTNSREYSPGTIPDMQWLADAFSQDEAADHFVTVSHIPPFDGDFDRSLEMSYASMLKKNKVLLSLHGHIHQYKDGYPYNDGVRYITSPSFDTRSFILLKITSGKVYDAFVTY